MLNENIKTIRKSKGLSQEELAIKLNVVRQTISKWENGLSVPDADMLISLSEVLETSVSTLLGETAALSNTANTDDLRAVCEKLEIINLQLARNNLRKRQIIHWSCAALFLITVIIFAIVIALGSPYFEWDYSSPETAVLGVGIHAFEWLFVRAAPFILIGSTVGFCLTREKP